MTESLSKAEIARYSRHLILPEVGMAGQLKLKSARVLMVGAGGLGAPLGLYLAAAGVGHLGLVDSDVVDASNLQRQVLYGHEDVGRPKLEAASKRLLGINPDLKLELFETRFTAANATDIARDYDIIVDGTDNFATRYLVNDLCVLEGKANVHGSVFRFEGQASVFDARRGPCYRCLYPEPPSPGMVPSCAEGGVLGILPGVMGLIQATETVKLILEQGDSLIGRLLLFDALEMSFREMKLKKNPDCSICGEDPAVTALVDYEVFCGTAPTGEESEDIPEVSATGLRGELDRGAALKLIDVREPHEFEICRLPQAELMPLGQLPAAAAALGKDEEVVVYCHHGVRGRKALALLREAGFTRLRNLAGGIDAWSVDVASDVPRY